MQEKVYRLADLDLQATYSYADYLLWQLEERIELIRGKIFKMSPAPSSRHQAISTQLQGLLFMYLRKSTCKLFSAPFDVRLHPQKNASVAASEIYSVVQPDLCVICDKNKIDEYGCIGAPDLVVEILSKGNAKKELKTKYLLYEESGVREYWVVYPAEQVLQQFVLNDDGKFFLKNSFVDDEIVTSHIFPDLEIDLKMVFTE